MKKISILAVAATAVVMASCDNGLNVSMNNGADSLGYDLGVAQTEGLKQYMTMQLGVDSAYLADFIKGMEDGCGEPSKAEEAYRKGLQVGDQIKQMAQSLTQEVYGEDSTKSISPALILAGLKYGLTTKDSINTDSVYKTFQSRLEVIKAEAMEQTYGEWKAKNEKYLQDNKKKEGVITLPSGVQYKVLEAGQGDAPADTAKVTCNYVGKLIDGTEFDSSLQEGREPMEIDLAQPRVIQGWVEVLKLMPAGSKWEVTIPQEMAYGAQNMGQIKPFSTLVFTIEILK